MTKIQVYKGDTDEWTINIKDSTGTAKNITGCTLFFTVKKFSFDIDAEAVISKVITVHSEPVNGVTTLSLSHADTEKEALVYIYDFKLLDTTNRIITYGTGEFEILQNITRRIV